MYFKRITQTTARLKIDDNYATLKRINADGSYTFDLVYSINRRDVAINNATYVDITIYDRSPSITQAQEISLDDIALRMQTSMTTSKMMHEIKKNYVLSKRRSDITKHINNTLTNDVSQAEYARVPTLKHVGELHRNNDIRPITRLLKTDTQNSNYGSFVKRYLWRGIRLGTDPSSAISGAGSVITERDSANGTLTLNHHNLERSARDLRDYLTSLIQKEGPAKTTLHLDNSDSISTYDTVLTNDFGVVDEITFKTKRNDTSNVFVVFELFDAKTGTVLETVTKLLHVSKHVSVHTSILNPPTVKVWKKSNGYDASIEIMQRCNVANGVDIYKKTVTTTLNEVSSYAYVGSVNMTCGDVRSIPVTCLYNSFNLYRFIPTYNGKKSSTYTNVVVTPKRNAQFSAVVLLATPVSSEKMIGNGVQLEALQIPDDVVSLQFLQRNMSTKQQQYSNIGAPIFLTQQAKESDYVSTVTNDVIDGNLYEFAVKLIYMAGEEKIVSHVIHEHLTPSPNKIDINVSNLTIDISGDPNVSFDVALDYVDNSFEEIKTMLERQGIKEYFDGDIEKQRDQLKWLLTYSVKRIDMSTGDVEDMGIITSSTFSDKLVRKKRPAKNLELGKTYRYVIEVMTRSPETLFEQYKKVLVDETTRKKYVFKPSKFHHPIALRTGTLTPSAGFKTNHAKSSLAHGLLGTSIKLDVTFGDNHASVISVGASTFDSSKVIITWQVHGDSSLIDHYVITRNVNGTRELVDKAHSQESNNKTYVHVLAKNEVGKCTYGIIPVMHNYTYGDVVTSNTVVYGMRVS